VRILGADLAPREPDRGSLLGTLVVLDQYGTVTEIRTPGHVPELISDIGSATSGEPFLLGVNLPVVVPQKQVRSRPLENLVRRRLGFKMPAGGRSALQAEPGALSGESLLASLAGAGFPCLTYPERSMRHSGMAEIHPALVLKTLLWNGSAMAKMSGNPTREELFKAYTPPAYLHSSKRGKSRWPERAAGADLALRALGGLDGYDMKPAAEALSTVSSEEEMDRVASLINATLIAGTVRRYLDLPEECAFIGARESGYTITPADGFIRRLVLHETGPGRGRLFPQESLRDSLGSVAKVRSLDLLTVRGNPQRIEASFTEQPLYEFDNLDEMLWWKHCRHLAGPQLPTEGLSDLIVTLGSGKDTDTQTLHLVRSRHKTLSFRFDNPDAWRARIATRDGKVYSFRIVRATYNTQPA